METLCLGCEGHPSSTGTTEAVTSQNSCTGETEKDCVILTALTWLHSPLSAPHKKLCWQATHRPHGRAGQGEGQGSLCTHAGRNEAARGCCKQYCYSTGMPQ